MTFPLGTADILTYIGYLMEERKVAGSTIEKYLTGLRYLEITSVDIVRAIPDTCRSVHLQKGHSVPALRPDFVQAVLQGAKQKDAMRDMKGKAPRYKIQKGQKDL